MPDGTYSPISAGYAAAFNAINFYWWDNSLQRIRHTNGATGLEDNSTLLSLWQMESFANVLTNDWLITGSEVSKRKLASQWAHIQSVPAFTPAVLAGNGAGQTIVLSDDAAWQCMYLMHVHMVTADPLALAYLSEAIVFNLQRFADPDTARNPIIDRGRTVNLPGIAYGTTPNNLPFKYNTYGVLYALPGTAEYSTFGKISTSYEAMMALCSLYVYEQLNFDPYLEYAKDTYKWIKNLLRTPNRSDPSRKAEGLYETELVLNGAGGVPRDSAAAWGTPVQAFYGKPLHRDDSTYLGAAFAMGVLAARLGRLSTTSATDRANYFAEAASIASAIISMRGYGRSIGGKTLIANTRDPWTEAHWAVPFAQEVLSLPGVTASCGQALIDTAPYVFANAVTSENRLTADWTGIEQSVAGPTTWEAEYNPTTGSQAGSKQIMTHSETVALIQAALVVDRRNRAIPYRGELYRV